MKTQILIGYLIAISPWLLAAMLVYLLLRRRSRPTRIEILEDQVAALQLRVEKLEREKHSSDDG